MANDKDYPSATNTDREIWRGPDEGNGSFYADSIHVTEGGSIGMNVGGEVIVMPIRNWFRAAKELLIPLIRDLKD